MTKQTTTLKELATRFGGQLQGEDVQITGVGTIQSGRQGQLAFLDSAKYATFAKDSKASALVTTPALSKGWDKPLLLSDNPKLLFAKVTDYFHPPRKPAPGIHQSAQVAPSCMIGKDVSIGAYCVVEEGVVLEDDVVLEPYTFVGAFSKIGQSSHLHPKVTLYHHTQVGAFCRIHSGVVIGSDGFGFANDQGKWHKVPQIGRVLIGDAVDIGANTTIDRGTLEDTIIGDGVILDNLIQIGHNVKIGKGTAIAAKTGIAGSCEIGAHCMIGGASMFNGHIKITDHCYFIPGAQVANSIKKPGVYASGIAAKERSVWARNTARFHHLDELAQKVRSLQKQVHALQEVVEESKA